MAFPSVSVVMPVRNAEAFLDESVRSILAQTHDDFELIALDDASSDGSYARLAAWAARDRRVRIASSPTPLGPVAASNAVAALARAPVLARMDADDRCAPDRLARQLTLLDARPDAVLVACMLEGIDAQGRAIRPRDRWRLVRRSAFAPFPHGSVMCRRSAFLAIGGYRQACVYWEDLDLYYRLSAVGRILVLPDALYQYRFHVGSVRLVNAEHEVERAIDLMTRCLRARCERGDYEHELDAPPGRPAQGSYHGPLSLALNRMWAGEPLDLRNRLRQRRVWSRSLPLRVALLAVAGDVSSPLLRIAMRGLIRARDLAAGRRVGTAPLEWHFA